MKTITTENKKVKNATVCEYNGIKFKSNFERLVYKTLLSLGIDSPYESCSYTLQNKFHAPHYWHKTKRGLVQMKGVQDIQYTPDFEFTLNGYKVFIEAKGFATDRYLIIKKLWLNYLHNIMPDAYFFEVKSLKNVRDAISIITSLPSNDTQ